MEALAIRCPGVENGTFLLDHTGRGRDLSPELILENLSTEAVTLAVTLEDMSHPIKNFTHWVIWNLPAADCIPGAIPSVQVYVPAPSTLSWKVQNPNGLKWTHPTLNPFSTVHEKD